MKRRRNGKRVNCGDFQQLTLPNYETEPAMTYSSNEPDLDRKLTRVIERADSKVCWLDKLRKVKLKHLPVKPIANKPTRPGKRRKKLSLIKGQSAITTYLIFKSPPHPACPNSKISRSFHNHKQPRQQLFDKRRQSTTLDKFQKLVIAKKMTLY